MNELPADVRKVVLNAFRHVVRREDRLMTYEEAAFLYGFQYQSIRTMVCRGRIRTVGRTPNRKISHRAMRAYLAGRKGPGCGRRALREAQTKLP